MATRRAISIDDDAPVYAISIAAQLAGLHPQTLRQYDRLALVSPKRTDGRNRLYSANDIMRLREVAELSDEGVSLIGIRRVLALQDEVEKLRKRIAELTREKTSTALVVWRPERHKKREK